MGQTLTQLDCHTAWHSVESACAGGTQAGGFSKSICKLVQQVTHVWLWLLLVLFAVLLWPPAGAI